MINSPYQTPQINADVFKCSLIDSRGREIPITEQMIHQACEDAETKQHNYYAQISKPSANR